MSEVVDEMHRRDHAVMAASEASGREEFWSGPDLHLAIDAIDQLDDEGRTALRHLLKWGRKLGIVGVARGPVGMSGGPAGVDAVTRAHLDVGGVLRFEPAPRVPVCA